MKTIVSLIFVIGLCNTAAATTDLSKTIEYLKELTYVDNLCYKIQPQAENCLSYKNSMKELTICFKLKKSVLDKNKTCALAEDGNCQEMFFDKTLVASESIYNLFTGDHQFIKIATNSILTISNDTSDINSFDFSVVNSIVKDIAKFHDLKDTRFISFEKDSQYQFLCSAEISCHEEQNHDYNLDVSYACTRFKSPIDQRDVSEIIYVYTIIVGVTCFVWFLATDKISNRQTINRWILCTGLFLFARFLTYYRVSLEFTEKSMEWSLPIFLFQACGHVTTNILFALTYLYLISGKECLPDRKGSFLENKLLKFLLLFCLPMTCYVVLLYLSKIFTGVLSSVFFYSSIVSCAIFVFGLIYVCGNSFLKSLKNRVTDEDYKSLELCFFRVSWIFWYSQACFIVINYIVDYWYGILIEAQYCIAFLIVVTYSLYRFHYIDIKMKRSYYVD